MRNLSDEEIYEGARNKTIPKSEREKYKTEEKFRKKRNTRKRKSHYSVYGHPLEETTIVGAESGFSDAAAMLIIGICLGGGGGYVALPINDYSYGIR